MIKNKLSFIKLVLILIILFSFGTLIGIITYSLSLKKSSPIAVQPTIEPTIESAVTPTLTVAPGINTSDWKTYKSEKFGIEFNYPTELFITERNQEIFKNYDATHFLLTNTENKNLISTVTVVRWKTIKPIFTPEDAGTFYQKLAFNRWYYFQENKNQIKTGKCIAEIQKSLPDLPTLQEQSTCEIQVQPIYIKIATNGQIIFYSSTLEITIPFENKNKDIISKIASSFKFK